MKRELSNELEPMSMLLPDFWENAGIKLMENPDKVLPVYTEDPEAKSSVQNFFLHFVKEDGKIFMQVEGFSTDNLREAFMGDMSDRWQLLQPGIYRLDVTIYAKGII